MIFHPSDWWDHSFHFLHKNAAADRVSKSPLRKKKHKRWRETDKNVKYLKSILYITYSHTFNFKRFVHHLLIVRLWNWHDESIRWRPISLKYVWRNLERKKNLNWKFDNVWFMAHVIARPILKDFSRNQ